MSQFRQNPVSKSWVLIAPNRAKRMEQFANKAPAMPAELPEVVGDCVFCPGNEAKNLEIAKFPDSHDWQVRVIPNKFEALSHTPFTRHAEFYVNRAGSGVHNVVITRKHNEPIAMQSIQTVELTLEVLKNMVLDFSERRELAYIQMFQNHGRDAGATLIHPHLQVLATPFIPPGVHDEMLGAYHYFKENGECIYCAITKEELHQKERVIFETDEFMVIAPYASRTPFETWIFPKKHSASFESIDAKQMKQLAYVLKVVLGQLYVKLTDPPFNFYIHTLPFVHTNQIIREERAYHWHLTIFPRISIYGGFEYATRIPINPVTPESAAEFLR